MREFVHSLAPPLMGGHTSQGKVPVAEVPSWQDAYTRYRPLLFSALSRLASQGYPVPPSEASELIHDFFADSWLGITRRYIPERAQFSTYIYGAFLNFARRRVVADRAWAFTLRPADEIIDFDVAAPSQEYLDNDKAALRAALERLPLDARQVLEALTGPGYSERQAAARLGLRRHRFRSLASQALARLAVEMNAPGIVAEEDFSLVRALWIECKSIDDTATALRMSPIRVRSAQQRIFQAIEKQLQGFHAVGVNRERDRAMSLCNLWKQFVENPADSAIAAQIRERSDEILTHLEDCEDCDMRAEALGPHLELFYAAFAGDQEQIDTAFLEEYEQAVADDEDRVTAAMKIAVFTRFPTLDNDLSILGERAPFLFFLATETISTRIHRYAVHDAASAFVLRRDGIHYRRQGSTAALIPWKDLEHELGVLANVDSSSARLLLEKALSVARSFPRLILGVESKPEGIDGVRLALGKRDKSTNLYEQWSPVSNATYTAIA